MKEQPFSEGVSVKEAGESGILVLHTTIMICEGSGTVNLPTLLSFLPRFQLYGSKSGLRTDHAVQEAKLLDGGHY